MKDYIVPKGQSLPPQIKELSDEELCELAVNNRVWLSHEIMMFARAVLKKASEK